MVKKHVPKNDVQRTVKILCWTLAGMFLFTWSLVPFYNLFCQVTGINGKVELTPAHRVSAQSFKKNGREPITMEFDVNHNRKMPLEFSPIHRTMQVVPGESYKTAYLAKNPTDRVMVIQAIPSISPGTAAKYLKKMECFCFQRQVLQPGESARMPIKFVLEPDLPLDVHRLTLSYTLFEIR